MDIADFASRLIKLREQKDVSAREMSLAIGQNESYINGVENQKSFPSMDAFFYICEYLGVTPSEFFAVEVPAPAKVKELAAVAERLPAADIDLLINLAKKIK